MPFTSLIVGKDFLLLAGQDMQKIWLEESWVEDDNWPIKFEEVTLRWTCILMDCPQINLNTLSDLKIEFAWAKTLPPLSCPHLFRSTAEVWFRAIIIKLLISYFPKEFWKSSSPYPFTNFYLMPKTVPQKFSYKEFRHIRNIDAKKKNYNFTLLSSLLVPLPLLWEYAQASLMEKETYETETGQQNCPSQGPRHMSLGKIT